MQVPRVDVLKNIKLDKLDEHIDRIIIHYGYMDDVDVPSALNLLKEKEFKISMENVTYFLGRESVVITKYTGMTPLRESLFDFLGRNSERPTMYFNLPSDRVFEIGSHVRL